MRSSEVLRIGEPIEKVNEKLSRAEEEWGLLFDGYGLYVGDDEKVLEIVVMMAQQCMNYLMH